MAYSSRGAGSAAEDGIGWAWRYWSAASAAWLSEVMENPGAATALTGYGSSRSPAGTCAVVKGSVALLPGNTKPPLAWSCAAIRLLIGVWPDAVHDDERGSPPVATIACTTSAVESGSVPEPGW